MLKRLVEYSYPLSDSQAKLYRKIVEQDSLSPYVTIDELRENLESLENAQTEQVSNPVSLEDIVTIHNFTGMRDFKQTETMIAKINRGDHVLSSDGLPNIKIVIAPNGKKLIFDGHHTILAYLFAGKKFLHQTPHILLSNQNKPLSPEEISFFFPEDKRSLVVEDWHKYTVNWQKDTDKIELREIETVGELFRKAKEAD